MPVIRRTRARILLVVGMFLLAFVSNASPVSAYPVLYIREYMYYDYYNGNLVGYEYADECTGYNYFYGERTPYYVQTQSDICSDW